jgi:hypothetical protein
MKSLVICGHCKKEFYRKTGHVVEAKKQGWRCFCSRECLSLARTKAITVKCDFCNKDVSRIPAQIKRSKSGYCFCSRRCSTSANNTRYKTGKNHPSYVDGISGYRIKALAHYGKSCSNHECPFRSFGVTVREELLDVHHIDGDRQNNDIDNLQVLCVYCHAVETRISKRALA